MKAHEILGVSPDATQKEITKEYRKLALKYHPDKNGGAEWARKKFIEVGEAYKTLSKSAPKRRFEFSNKPGSNKFEEFEEMLSEVEEELKQMKRENAETQENLNRERERVRGDAIKSIEEKFISSSLFPYNLDSGLWVPYSDWKEKMIKCDDREFPFYFNQIISAVEEAIKKNNYNFGQGYYGYEEKKRGKNFPPSDERDRRNNDKGPTLSLSDKIENLKEEIERNRKNLPKLSRETERKKCQEIINGLEKELNELQSLPNPSGSNDDWNKEKEALLKQIEDLKNQNKQAELIDEIDKLKQLVQQLEKELNELKEAVQELKKENNNTPEFRSYLTRKENELQVKQSRLEQLKNIINSNSNSNFPTGWVIGGGVLLAAIGLGALLFVARNRKKNLR